MTKIVKIEESQTITNEMFTKLGETLYFKDEVEAIKMKIRFKKGLTMDFKRDKERDEMDEVWEEMKGDKE